MNKQIKSFLKKYGNSILMLLLVIFVAMKFFGEFKKSSGDTDSGNSSQENIASKFSVSNINQMQNENQMQLQNSIQKVFVEKEQSTENLKHKLDEDIEEIALAKHEKHSASEKIKNLEKEKWNKEQEQLRTNLLTVIETTMSATQDRMLKHVDEKFKTLSLNDEQNRIASENKMKKELEEFTHNLLKIIDNRLAISDGKTKESAGPELKMMVQRLKDTESRNHGKLRFLNDKLAAIQQEKMAAVYSEDNDSGGTITQNEVDSLIKNEVKKQLSSVKSRRNPRFARLRKVVALEKMRRMIRGLADGDDYEDDVDF